jgi:antitoxin ParD1/3/4
MATMNISLPDQMKDWVEKQVATGRFANSSDYVRDLVRLDQARSEGIARLQAEIDKGRASPSREFNRDELLKEIEEHTAARLKKTDAA